jgi:hypothetical protein
LADSGKQSVRLGHRRQCPPIKIRSSGRDCHYYEPSTAGLVALFIGLLVIQVSLPPSGELAFAMLPPNTTPCLSAYASVVIAKWVYDWNRKIFVGSSSKCNTLPIHLYCLKN